MEFAVGPALIAGLAGAVAMTVVMMRGRAVAMTSHAYGPAGRSCDLRRGGRPGLRGRAVEGAPCLQGHRDAAMNAEAVLPGRGGPVLREPLPTSAADSWRPDQELTTSPRSAPLWQDMFARTNEVARCGGVASGPRIE